MIIEIASTIAMAGLAGFSYLQKEGATTNESGKIQKIFVNAGWIGKGGETLRIHKRNKIEGGLEYVFQIPLGFDRKRIMDNAHIIQDGLNTRKMQLQFDPRDLLKVKFDKSIVKEIRRILTTQKITEKEIEIEFDGMLKIKVYDEPTPQKIIWDEEMLKPDSWAVLIGKKRNKSIYHDFDKRKHLIVAGATGGGKSFIIKCIITALILSQPENVSFSLIDLKGGPAFARFKDCKQVERFGTDNSKALEILKEVQQRMNLVYRKVIAGGFEDVIEAGIKERHFIIIDEAADLADDKRAMEILTDIVRKGRGAGVYVIYSTQYPSAQAIPMQIKRNIPARLCFVLDSSSASMTVLDAPGAEDLPEIPGRCIYKGIRQNVLQAPYLSNERINKLIGPHIVEKIKKGESDEQDGTKTKESGKHTFIIE